MVDPNPLVNDIFLSYSRDDQQTARLFANAFEASGLRVWWDTTLRAGEAYDEVTEAALRSARAVVVLWSPRAVSSRWVRAEATIALRNKTLVPCAIEACERPIMFELTQTADLHHWAGARDDPRWLAFLGDVTRRVGADVTRRAGADATHSIGDAVAGRTEASAAPPKPAPKPTPKPARSNQSERRQLTFLSCRIDEPAGSAAERDPEDWHALIQTVAPPLSAILAGLDGNPAWKSNQVDAVFGYPVAHEDAAERAVCAGLAIIAKVASLAAASAAGPAAAFHARVGIHTATALVGRGSDGGIEVFGDGAGVALRVLEATPPGSVAFTGDVAELVAGRFEQQRLADCTAADGSAPIAVYSATGARRGGQRSDAAGRSGRHFVGRDDELALLTSRWRRAAAGDGQHVLIKGQPGIGKSRLLEAFHASIGDQPHRRINWHGASLFANTPFYAVVQMLTQMLEADGGDPAAALQRALAAADMPPAAFDLVAAMMGLALPADHVAAELAPTERRRLLLETLANWVSALARQQPLILAVEDLHWTDPSTMELVQMLVEQGSEVPLLLIGTARPEFQKGWPDRDHHGQINLGRLDAAQTRALVTATIGDTRVDDAEIDTLIARTDGVPFFVEELARRLGTRGAGSGGKAGAIPTTLRDLLAARIDRLGDAKETAQLGAILGRSFGYEMIEAIAGIDAADLEAHLGLMTSEELVQQRGMPPRSTYSFKHALIHEAAYELLPKSRRTREHRRVAALISARFAEHGETHPEILAHHHANGGSLDEAARFWLRAGQQALRRNAHLETIAHLHNALACVAALPDTTDTRMIELDIQVTLGTATVVAKGQASPEIEAVWNRALALARQLGDTARHGQAIFGLWLFETVGANHSAALAHSNAIVDLARSSQNDDLLITGTLSKTSSSFFLGRVDDVIEGSTAILAAYDGERHAAHRFQFGQDPAAMARAYLGQALWLRGDFAAAAAASADALGFARAIGHLYSLAHVIAYSAWMEQYIGADARLALLADELTALCTKERIPLFLGNGVMLTGWLRHRRGEADGPAVYEQGLDIYRATGSRCFLPYRWSVLGEALSQRGDHQRAAALFEDAIAAIAGTRERWAEPEVHRLHAAALARAGADREQVIASFERAISSARELGLGAWEQRAVAGLAAFAAQFAPNGSAA